MNNKFVEVLLNEYWMYDNEPSHLVRFIDNNKIYLFGKYPHNSIGIESIRAKNGWLEPNQDQINMIEKILKAKLAGE